MSPTFWSLVRSLGRGRLTRVDDGGPCQLVQMQLSQTETRDATPRMAEYGFESNPPAGADAVAVFLAGNRTNGVVIACGHQQYRMRGLTTGEVAISDNKGQSVYLSAAGIVVNGGGLPMKFTNTPQVTVDTPLMHCTGNITADGDITDNIKTQSHSMAQGRAIYNGHTHPVKQVQSGGSTVTSDPPNQPQKIGDDDGSGGDA
ncbi:phage baseplate assembly protein V [Paraburkholderia sp. HD33-4]|uniref:phage baseplate assembly protein V n=1 Tax=Paraburkholderia sp. HD33-4 TaxID=2883242 RepID=UPI001F39417B|nr:phage baseplate assembly protein V [Paraburkholderia sp. HD33-4]